jgi:hypothetical protein
MGKIFTGAVLWVTTNSALVDAEWQNMGNPEKR